MTAFAEIGYLYSDAGLLNLLHESGVYAPGTAQQILSGRDFDRALRAFRLIDEALPLGLSRSFKEWCVKQAQVINRETHEAVQKIVQAVKKEDNVHTVVDENVSAIAEYMEHLLKEFRTAGRAASPLLQLWDDCLQRVMLPVKVRFS